MAQRVEPVIVGIDTSKATLEVNTYGASSVSSVDNNKPAIRAWLKTLPPHAVIGIEATGVYHLELVDAAYRAGLQVFVIDGYRLSRYRESVGQRAKTDLSDAQLIARYVARERDELRPYRPLPPAQRRFWKVLKRRAQVVEAKKALRQSLSDMGRLQASVKATLRQLDRLVSLLEKELMVMARSLGWMADVLRVKAQYGVGKLTALMLIAVYYRANFSSVDAYVAFMGLDVRVRDSGKFKGKRKLTKQGEPECRRLLFNAARAAVRGDAMKPYYERLLARGKSTTQATVAVMRKLARISFALLRDQSEYQQPIMT